MKTRILFVALAVAAIVAMPAAAQTAGQEPAAGAPWSLDDCIGYALENNISVQQRALQVDGKGIQLSTAKFSRLPNLNASIGGSADFGRAMTKNNTYESTNSTSGSLSVSSNMPLFQGMRINNDIKGGKLDLEAAIQDLNRAREDLSINIMTLYLQALYAQEMVGVAERQLELSTQQADRSRQLFEAGKQPESARYESDALRANDELTLTQARNDLQIALLNLSQALNRPSAAGFSIVKPAFDEVDLASTLGRLGSATSVYDYAVENRPHIKAERLRLESSEVSVKSAKSSLYPSLSLSGGYGTGAYDSDPDKLWTQMRNNSREYVGLSMSIPIFNRRATRNSIRTAQLSVKSQQLALTDAELSLRKEIEQAWYNADAAHSKYLSADAALESARVAFGYEQEKANEGRSTVFDFNDAKTRMERAESNLVQAKYEFVFRSKILDFYRGRPLTL